LASRCRHSNVIVFFFHFPRPLPWPSGCAVGGPHCHVFLFLHSSGSFAASQSPFLWTLIADHPQPSTRCLTWKWYFTPRPLPLLSTFDSLLNCNYHLVFVFSSAPLTPLTGHAPPWTKVPPCGATIVSRFSSLFRSVSWALPLVQLKNGVTFSTFLPLDFCYFWHGKV